MPTRRRKRILPKSNLLPAIEDNLTFIKNKSSDNAKKLGEIAVSFATHLWIDKHYHIRYQFGDDNGPRTGIEPDTVEKLVKKAIPFLLFFSTAVAGFSFVNLNNNSERPVKIVLKEGEGNDTLNVVVEAHFVEINKFEITIKTAMRVEDFRLHQGQYALEVLETNCILYRNNNNRMFELCEI